ncbi:hypothetical protein [Chryseobacterium echinoideorum]|uniref:hypothetical protein n=1 Tax=Chryseobacterium echinoideorum TaxID=1549648 RepID=UPI0011868C18|nr:hypothetical protein [Chryseobacterium echinoideorum]
MNIDELKNMWNDDQSEKIPEINMEDKNRIHLPLEKIRKNMKMEFWSTLGIFIFAFALITFCEAPFKFKFYISILIASMIFVTVFFFTKFFKLYRNMTNMNLNTLEGLKDLMLQLELNKQYYLSFYVAFAPFLVCELLIVLEFIPRPVPLSDLQIAVTLITTLIVSIFLLFIFGKWWFNRFYGQYIKKIESLFLQLKNN